MLAVRQIMTDRVVTITPQDSVRDAIELLLARRISGLPVIDDAGRLVGVLTEFALLAIAYDQRMLNDTVAQHMTADVLTVEADDPVSKAADLFIVHRVRRAPVLQRGRLVGLVARRDVLESLYKAEPALTK
ncbi:MAG: CBS domain-containing protein [Pirellulales bacterium]|nr:CBS domain-containing protein [Pirellulales bacterium]